MLAALMMSLALTGQDACAADASSDACAAGWRARPNCFDDNLTDRCAEAEQARVRALLGMASIEEEAASGAEIYRAFFVDGFGRDLPAVSFERRPNEPPKVVIYGMGRQRSGPVVARTWDQVVGRSRHAAKAISNAPPESDGVDETVICLHSWVATFEATTNDRGQAGIRRRTEGACQRGLTMEYAFELAALAVSSLPMCDRLKPENHRNDVARLAMCLMLEGDALAAADLLNEKGDPPRPQGAAVTADQWREWLGSGHAARIDWSGETFAERQPYYRVRADKPDLPQFLVLRAEATGAFNLYAARYVGESVNRARVEGEITYVLGDPDESQVYMAADYVQTWVRTSEADWRLDAWTIGTFSTRRYPD